METSPRHELAPDLAALETEAPVVLRAGTCFEGVLALPGPARISGSLKGRVVGPGPLWVEEGARVEADLDVEIAVIAGQVEGDIRARARIELLPSAAVTGDLEAPTLRVAEGCRWNGHSRTGSRD